MKKLFISQPMRGKTDGQILMEREAAICFAKKIIAEEVEVIDTFYTDFSVDAKPIEYLARSITDLAKADVAFFCDGWQDYRGCKIEHECAKEYGIKCIEAVTLKKYESIIIGMDGEKPTIKAKITDKYDCYDDMPNYVTLKRGLEYHNGLL
jgi:hypothetical protein